MEEEEVDILTVNRGVESFEKSLETFEQNIRDNFDDLEKIQWQDENIIIEIVK